MSAYMCELLLEVKGQLGSSTVEDVFTFLNHSGITLTFRYKLTPFIQANTSDELPELDHLQQLLIIATSNGGVNSVTFSTTLATIAKSTRMNEHRYRSALIVLHFIMGITSPEGEAMEAGCLRAYVILTLVHAIWSYKAEHGKVDIVKDFVFLEHEGEESDDESETDDYDEYETDEDEQEEDDAGPHPRGTEMDDRV